MKEMRPWSEKLQEVIEALKTNQRQLSLKLNVTSAYINDILKGKNQKGASLSKALFYVKG